MTRPINSIVVDFTAASDGAKDEASQLLLEPDTRDTKDGGLNIRSTPLYSDPYFLLLYTNQVQHLEFVITSGEIRAGATPYIRKHSEVIWFDGNQSHLASYPVLSVVSAQWVGNDLGTPTILRNRVIEVPKLGYGVLKLEYLTSYRVVQLNAPHVIPSDFEDYPIQVSVFGQEVLED